jgi:glycosyltransferase involved in cell wall biosynthesis
MASVDICIPCYQYGRYLGDCIRSVQEQGIDDLRILIIDNASTDDSVEVARQFAAADPRIEVRARPVNLGPHASFNEGVDWAASDYFMLSWADDIVPPGTLMRAVAFMEQHPDVSFTTGENILFQQGAPLPTAPMPDESEWRLMTGPDFIADRCRKLTADQIVVRTAAQKQAGHYRPALFFTNDFEMLLRLAMTGNVGITKAPQSFRRMHGANLCDVHKVDRARDLREFEAAFISFFEREGQALSDARQLGLLAKRHLVESAYWWGVRDLTKARWQSGLKLLKFAAQRSPRTILVPPFAYLCEEGRPFHWLRHMFRGNGETSRAASSGSP